MNDPDPSIESLLEELLESGNSPEVVCAKYPHLLELVEKRWNHIQSLNTDIESLFPTPRSEGVGVNGSKTSDSIPYQLPVVPGHRVEGIIGTGGTGVVYRAWNLRLDRPVAIKMLLLGQYAKPNELESLLQEARAVAGLQHPHIVQIFEVGDLDGLPYFTMELLEGGSLADQLRKERMLPRDGASLIATLAQAVRAAHQGGLVHRDIKPGNVLLTESGTPKIADFGLARPYGPDAEVTLASSAFGTPSYMAPEQILGKPSASAPTVDVYALGTLLYEVLTGQPAFRGSTPAETLRQVLHDVPIAPTKLNPAIPRDLGTICMKCLEHDPAARYACATDLSDDIHRYLRGEPVNARRVGRSLRLLKWARRKPSQATAIAASLLCVAVLSSVLIGVALKRYRTIALVHEDLREVVQHQEQLDWGNARTAIERARTRLESSPIGGLRAEIEQASSELDLAVALESVGLQQAEIINGRYRNNTIYTSATKQYMDGFNTLGIHPFDDDPMVAAHRIQQSSIESSLASALDLWVGLTVGTQDEDQRAWLLEVGDLIETNDMDWLDRAREPTTWNDLEAIESVMNDWQQSHDGSTQQPTHFCVLMLSIADQYNALGGDAIPFLRRLQLQNPSDFRTNFHLASMLSESDPAASLRFYQSAVSLRPQSALARANLGVAIGILGQIDESISQLRIATMLDPELSVAHNNLANALISSGQIKEAINEYQIAVKLSPSSAHARSNYGRALEMTGKLPEAMEQWKLAIESDPEYPVAYASLGLAQTRLGKFEDAYETLSRAIDIDPGLTATHINFAVLLRQQGRIDEAKSHMQTAVSLDPKDAEVRFHAAEFYARIGDTESARESYRESIQLNPSFVKSYLGLGMLEGESGNLDGAIEQFVAALKIDPEYHRAKGTLGRVYMIQGRYTEARDLLIEFHDSLSENDPSSASIMGHIQLCESMIERSGQKLIDAIDH
tara:strand:- start:12293 stop:15175 length:2883 start_codon:yes stop_codon:yes gene_type:complete